MSITPKGRRPQERFRIGWIHFRRAVSRIWARQKADHVVYLSASLAYFSLLALVPISAISLSFFASFVSGEEDQEKIFNWVVGYVFPFDEDLRVDWRGVGGVDWGKESDDEVHAATPEISGGSPAASTREASAADAQRTPPPAAIGGATAETKKDGVHWDLAEIQKDFQEKMDAFVRQARGLKEIGFLILIIAGFWLFDSIEDAFNSIWRSEKRRPFVRRFIIFWTVLTLPPLLMVGPVILNRYLETRDIHPTLDVTLRLLPYFLTWLAVWLMYLLLPNGYVDLRAAGISAFVVAFFWEIVKRGFATYVSGAESYQIVYGSLSIILFVLAWVYYTWLLLLMGLEMTAYLQYPDWDKHTPYGELAPEISLLYSWGSLYYTGRNFVQGKGGTKTESISTELGLDHVRSLKVLQDLEAVGILVRDREGAWYPSIPLEKITWAEVASRLRFEVEPSSVSLSEWLESALRARGVVEYRQDTQRLPTLDSLLKQRMNRAVLAGPANGEPEAEGVSAEPVFVSGEEPAQPEAPSSRP